VFISNPQAGGAGITLTAARYAIYFSRSFSFGDSAQSEDRIHRIGQERDVMYIDIVADKTIDTYIIKSLQGKNDMSKFMNAFAVQAMAGGDF
jgi:SNF2 family DNA or RNA helicase